MTRSVRGTEVLSRVLVQLLPRSLRREYGDSMVQLARDRRRHGGEPLWRLWPSLVADTASASVRLRWEEAMFPVRAVLLGLGLAVVTLAFASGDPIVGIAVAAVAGLVAWRLRPDPIATVGGRPWLPWIATGAALCVIGVGLLVLVGNEDASPMEWLGIIGSLFLGWAALGTGSVLAFGERSGSRPGARTPS